MLSSQSRVLFMKLEEAAEVDLLLHCSTLYLVHVFVSLLLLLLLPGMEVPEPARAGCALFVSLSLSLPSSSSARALSPSLSLSRRLPRAPGSEALRMASRAFRSASSRKGRRQERERERREREREQERRRREKREEKHKKGLREEKREKEKNGPRSPRQPYRTVRRSCLSRRTKLLDIKVESLPRKAPPPKLPQAPHRKVSRELCFFLLRLRLAADRAESFQLPRRMSGTGARASESLREPPLPILFV